MQTTRKQILEVLNERGQSTVREIVEALHERRGDGITAVTVRHHLNLLQKQNCITTTECQHHDKPGRPQYVYHLTEEAQKHMPTNYAVLTGKLLDVMQNQMPQNAFNVILEGVADDMASCATIPEDLPLLHRLDRAVEYLNKHGYTARYETTDDGYILHTYNCPYHEVATKGHALCKMDARLVASLVGRVPQRVSLITDGEASCGYLIPYDYDDDRELN